MKSLERVSLHCREKKMTHEVPENCICVTVCAWQEGGCSDAMRYWKVFFL